jgi:hypothetical protein
MSKTTPNAFSLRSLPDMVIPCFYMFEKSSGDSIAIGATRHFAVRQRTFTAGQDRNAIKRSATGLESGRGEF